MRHILVTGATGFIGQAVVRCLLQKGYEVRALTRSKNKWPFQEHEHLEQCIGSMEDKESLERACKDIDAVIHLAAKKADEPESHAVNVEGAKNLCLACAKQGVENILYVSTQSAKLQRLGTYGRTKKEAEDIFQSSGIPTTILRPSLVYGDGSSGVFATLMSSARWPVTPVIGDGNAHYRPIHADDLALGIEHLIRHTHGEKETFDVGGPDELTLNALLHVLGCKQNTTVRLLHIPLWLGFLLANIFSILPRPPITKSNVLGSAQDVTMDIGSFCAAVGFVPRSFLKDFDATQADATYLRKEGIMLLGYVSGMRPSKEMAERYVLAVQKLHVDTHHHISAFGKMCLGPLDAATKIIRPHGTLQKKILIAAALYECDPSSAEKLLPRERNAVMILLSVSLITIIWMIKAIFGFLLFIIPGFYRRNA